MDHVDDVDSCSKLHVPVVVSPVELIESDNAREAELILVTLPSELLRHAFGSFDQHVRLEKIDVPSRNVESLNSMVGLAPSRSSVFEERNHGVEAAAPQATA